MLPTELIKNNNLWKFVGLEKSRGLWDMVTTTNSTVEKFWSNYCLYLRPHIFYFEQHFLIVV